MYNNNDEGDTDNNETGMNNLCAAFIDDHSLCSDSYISSRRDWRLGTTTSQTSTSGVLLSTNKLYANDIERRAEVRNFFFGNGDTVGRGMDNNNNDDNDDKRNHGSVMTAMMRNGNGGSIITNDRTDDSKVMVDTMVSAEATGDGQIGGNGWCGGDG